MYISEVFFTFPSNLRPNNGTNPVIDYEDDGQEDGISNKPPEDAFDRDPELRLRTEFPKEQGIELEPDPKEKCTECKFSTNNSLRFKQHQLR